MDYLTFEEAVFHSFLNGADAFVKIGHGNAVRRSVLNLNHEHGIDLTVMLFVAILIPMLTFIDPFVGGCLKNCHIVAGGFRVCNDDAILQKTGSADFFRFRFDVVSSGMDTFRKTIETSPGCGHTDNDRHRRQFIVGRSLEELLHDRRVLGQIARLLSTSVRFINNEIEMIRLLTDGIGKRFPDGILSAVAVLGQITALGKLLCVEKIDVSVFEDLTVKRIIADGDTLIQRNLFGFHVNFEF